MKSFITIRGFEWKLIHYNVTKMGSRHIKFSSIVTVISGVVFMKQE